ncbi:MAG: glycosyltransferase family 4 protein [Gammaproteobacteria bacterium]
MNRKKVLFFGELAPGVVHGISLSNRLNVDLLSQHTEMHIIEELTDLAAHGKRNRSKFLGAFRSIKKIFTLNRLNRCDYLYTVFSLSTFGSLKTLGSLIGFRSSGKGQVVLHIHRGDFHAFYNRSVVNRWIATLVFWLTDKLIVLSERQKDYFVRYVDEKKLRVLENSLNTEHEFSDRTVGDSKFIFISNYIEEKGVFELLDVFEKNNEIELKCFGRFVNNQDAIEKYSSQTIHIQSFIDGEEKFRQIHESDALILPSWNEGQPTIILEAMMVGTIVLTTRVGLIGEMLGDDYPFYFDEKNSDSLKLCIAKFRSYKDKEELSRKLKDNYRQHYSKDMHEQKLLRIFS